MFANSRPSASNFKSFSQSQNIFFSHRRAEQFCKQNTIQILVKQSQTCVQTGKDVSK